MRTVTALVTVAMLALSGCAIETAQQTAPRAYVVYFQRGSAELTPEAQAIVAEIAGTAQKAGSAEIAVEGAADRAGNSDADLAARRAAAVENALRAAGVPNAMVSVRSDDSTTAAAGGVAARGVKITLVAQY
jgi:cytochrome c oxidase subunit 2